MVTVVNASSEGRHPKLNTVIFGAIFFLAYVARTQEAPAIFLTSRELRKLFDGEGIDQEVIQKLLGDEFPKGFQLDCATFARAARDFCFAVSSSETADVLPASISLIGPEMACVFLAQYRQFFPLTVLFTRTLAARIDAYREAFL